MHFDRASASAAPQAAHCRFALYRLWREDQGHTVLYGPRLGCTRIADTLKPDDIRGCEWLPSLDAAETRAIATALALRRAGGREGAGVEVMAVRDWDRAHRQARAARRGRETPALELAVVNQGAQHRHRA